MILIAYSGSSKADWMLQSESISITFQTIGMNPFLFSEKDIVRVLQQQPDVQKYQDEVKEVCFFGAGCLNPDCRERISNALSIVFKGAFISVEQDILGASYATCGTNKGLSCILGTGSNSAYFDGLDVYPSKNGLGYILGDEGSAAYFGKKLIKDFLYGTMPIRLRKAFCNAYHLNKEDVVRRIYRRSMANVYLGSFAPFMSEHLDSMYITDLLYVGFDEFIKINVHCFGNYDQYPCHFIGSIAHHFQDILRAVCDANNIKTGKIVHRPIEGLSEFIKEMDLLRIADQ